MKPIDVKKYQEQVVALIKKGVRPLEACRIAQKAFQQPKAGATLPAQR